MPSGLGKGDEIATLIVKSGPLAGQRFEVEGELVIGREDADITIGDPQISRRHAVVRPSATGLEIEDAGSSNGTFVNGDRISGGRELAGGDSVRVGQTELDVEVPVQAGTVIADQPAGVADAPQGTVVAPKDPPSAAPSPEPAQPERPAAASPGPGPQSPPSSPMTPSPGGGPAPYTPPGSVQPPGGPSPYSPQGGAPYGGPPSGPPTGPGPAYAPPTGPQYAAPVQPKQMGPRSSGSKVWLIVLIAGVAVLIAAALLFFFVLKESDEDEIREVLETVSTSPGDPDTCDLFSQSFKEENSGETGTAADDACRENVDADDEPFDIKIKEIDVTGDNADVRASVDGDLGIVKMVNEDGDWKIDDFENL